MIRLNISKVFRFFSLPFYYFKDPPAFNIIINKIERTIGSVKCFSYPLVLGINTSNICNQHCVFCSMDNKNMKTNNWITPDIFEKMKWLKFVSRIDLFCGAGEALTNPNFPDIVYTVKRVAPKSQITLFTNGLALEGRNLKAIVDCFDMLHISVNAATKKGYESIIQGNYEKEMRNLEELSKLRPEKLEVELSMVLMKRTIKEVKPLIDLTSKLGFQRLIVAHFIVNKNRDEIGIEESVKPNKEICNYIHSLKDYAEKQGIGYSFCETAHVNGKCESPWTTAYISNDEIGDRWFGFCCSGGRTNIHLKEDIYFNFKRVWNHERLQEVRRTVNKPPELTNNLCFLCQMADKTDADWRTKLEPLLKKRGITLTEKGDPNAFEEILV